MAPNRRQTVIWDKYDLVYWRRDCTIRPQILQMPVCSVTFRDYPMSKGDQAPNGASPPAKIDDCRTRQNFLKKSMSFNSFKWDIVHHAVVFKNWPMISKKSLQWRHSDHDGVSNRQPHGCLLNRLFRRRSKKTSKLPRHWPLCGEFTGTGEFPAQRAS